MTNRNIINYAFMMNVQTIWIEKKIKRSGNASRILVKLIDVIRATQDGKLGDISGRKRRNS